MRDQYQEAAERLKKTFDIDVQRGAFRKWKEGLSDAARSHLSDHDMAELDKAFMDVQIHTAQKVEHTIATRLYSADDMRLMYHMGERTFPWAKPKGGR